MGRGSGGGDDVRGVDVDVERVFTRLLVNNSIAWGYGDLLSMCSALFPTQDIRPSCSTISHCIAVPTDESQTRLSTRVTSKAPFRTLPMHDV